MVLRDFRALMLVALASAACSAGGSEGGGESGSGGSAASAGSGGSSGGAGSGGSSGGGGTGASSSGGSGGGTGGVSGGTGGTSGTGGTAPGGTGGTGNAGTGGGGAGTGGSGGGGATPLFFDDFEAATLGPSWIHRENPPADGAIALDTTRAHGGAQALRVRNGGFSTFLAIEGGPVFPAPNNTFYARVWLFAPELPPSQHVVWMEAGDVDNDQHEVRLGTNLGHLQTNLWLNGEVDLRAPGVLTANAWHCVELEFGNDELVVWFNGTRVDAISTTNWLAVTSTDGGANEPMSNWSPTYEAFRLGWELNGGGLEIWYDDVALSHEPIGCD